MDIQIDTREKQRAIRKIIKTFDDNGVKHFSSKLLVGDYMSLDNPRLIIDRKQNLQELCGNVCQQHERFKRDTVRCCPGQTTGSGDFRTGELEVLKEWHQRKISALRLREEAYSQR